MRVVKQRSPLLIAVVATTLSLQAVAGCARGSSDADRSDAPATLSDVTVDPSETPVIQNIATELGTMVVVAFPNGDYQTWFIRKQDGRVTSLGHKTSIAENLVSDRLYIDHNSDTHDTKNGTITSRTGTDSITVAPPTPTNSQ